MKAVALCLLAVRGASFDLTTKDVGDLLDGVHYHHSTLRSFVKEHVPLPLDIIIPPQPVKPPSDEACGECHAHGAKWVMEHAVHKIVEVCKMAMEHHCGKMARVCMMMRRHEAVTLGMLTEHVRPFALSAAYCAGKRVCHHHADNGTLSEIVMGSEAHDLVLQHFDEVDWDEVLQQAAEPEEDEHEEKNVIVAVEEEEVKECDAHGEKLMAKKAHSFCPHCFKAVMMKTMWKAAMGVRMMCHKHHDCPKMRKMCEWAKDHKEVAFGMLLAKVEPWKFAMGACHRREHHHGEHGDHHHHHGDHHHHHHWKKAKEFVKNVAHKVSEMITV